MVRKRDLELTAQIVQKASLGATKRKIAHELNTSETTVNKHLKAIKAEHNDLVSAGKDPQIAWGEVLAGIIIGAGVAGTILAGMKIIDELRKAMEERERF